MKAEELIERIVSEGKNPKIAKVARAAQLEYWEFIDRILDGDITKVDELLDDIDAAYGPANVRGLRKVPAKAILAAIKAARTGEH